MSSRSTFRGATWRFTGRLLKVSVGLMWSIGRRATTWISAGDCRPTVGLSRFLRVRLSGTIGVLRCRLFVSSRRVTVRRSRCCVSSTSFFLAPRARRNGRDKFTGPHGSLGFSTVRLFTTAYLGKGYFSRYIPPHNRKLRRTSVVLNG